MGCRRAWAQGGGVAEREAARGQACKETAKVHQQRRSRQIVVTWKGPPPPKKKPTPTPTHTENAIEACSVLPTRTTAACAGNCSHMQGHPLSVHDHAAAIRLHTQSPCRLALRLGGPDAYKHAHSLCRQLRRKPHPLARVTVCWRGAKARDRGNIGMLHSVTCARISPSGLSPAVAGRRLAAVSANMLRRPLVGDRLAVLAAPPSEERGSLTADMAAPTSAACDCLA